MTTTATTGRALTILVHAPSKAGKSTLSTTSPAPRLLFDVESASRFLPIKRVYWDPATGAPPTADGTWDTCVVQTRSWQQVEQAYRWLEAGHHDFKSVVIDSISELQNRYMEMQAGRSQLTQQQWGEVFRSVAGLIRDMRDLTMHPTKPIECLVMIAMTKEIGGVYRPYVQGQLATVLPYLLDAVGYLYVDTVNEVGLDGETTTTREVRRLLTRPTPNFEAGERVGGVWPIVIEDPNITTMIADIFDREDAPEAMPAVEPVAATPAVTTPATPTTES